MAELEEFCTMELELDFTVVGKTPGAGLRIDMPFRGTATSSHWEGERPVQGVDYVSRRPDGHMELHLHGRVGEGDQAVAYRGTGLSLVPEKNVAEPRELIQFETASEELAFLNTSIGVGLGRGEGNRLSLTIYLVKA